jgi:hypothetical protein
MTRVCHRKCMIARPDPIDFFLSGCATYEPTEKPIALNTNLDQKVAQLTGDGLEMRVLDLREQQLAKGYVGIDPQRSGMLPLLLKVRNDTDRILKVDLAQSALVAGSGESFPYLSTELSIERARINDAQNVGWTLAFGLMGGLVSGSKTAAANQSLDDDYRKKCFKPTLVMTRNTGEGIVFFDVPGDKQATIVSLELLITDIDKDESRHISIPLK